MVFKHNPAGRGARWLIAAALLLARPVQAESPPWLDWTPPPECPTAAEVGNRVSGWLGGPMPPDTDLRVKGTLNWNGELWEVSVDIYLGGRLGTRRVAVRDCYDAAEFVAVAVVLAVDPSLAESVQIPEPAPSEAPSEAVEEPELQPPEPDEPSPEPALSSPNIQPQATAAPANAAVSLHVTSAAAGAMGVLPDPALGVDLALGGDIGRLSVTAAGVWFPPASTTVEQAVAPIDFSLLSARVSAAYLVLGDRTSDRAGLGPLLSVAGGTFRAKQRASGATTVVEPWFSLGVGAVALVELHPAVSLVSELELEVPLARPAFVLSDGTRVYQVGIGGYGALGLRFFFRGW